MKMRGRRRPKLKEILLHKRLGRYFNLARKNIQRYATIWIIGDPYFRIRWLPWSRNKKNYLSKKFKTSSWIDDSN